MERSVEVLKKAFFIQPKNRAYRSSKRPLLERTQRRFGKFLFCLKNKSCFFKYSVSQDISNAGWKSQSSERSVQKIAQMKRDSAFEQKTRMPPSRDTSGSSQNIFFSYNQRKKQSRAQTDNFGTYSTSFWKVGVFFLVKSPNISRKVCRKIIKTIAYKTKRRRPRFRKYQKLLL